MDSTAPRPSRGLSIGLSPVLARLPPAEVSPTALLARAVVLVEAELALGTTTARETVAVDVGVDVGGDVGVVPVVTPRDTWG